jgi:hypothetical protein
MLGVQIVNNDMTPLDPPATAQTRINVMAQLATPPQGTNTEPPSLPAEPEMTVGLMPPPANHNGLIVLSVTVVSVAVAFGLLFALRRKKV